MCWRKNVHWGVHTDDDPKKFMTVTSGQFVLAIPDYNHQARNAADAMVSASDARMDASGSFSSWSTLRSAAIFKKVIMKLDGPGRGVQWIAGLMFERNISEGERSFISKPHYDIVLKNPKYAKACDDQV